MLNVLYFTLALLATLVTVWYTWFYQVSIPGTQYNYTYAGIALMAAIIFAGLWLAGIVNKEQTKSRIIIK
jgi:FtsH-binding integral membrane protein